MDEKRKSAVDGLVRAVTEFGDACDGGHECHFDGGLPLVACNMGENASDAFVYAVRVKDGSVTLLVKECGGSSDYPSETTIGDVDDVDGIIGLTSAVKEVGHDGE